MWLKALACDYDGTLAIDGRLVPEAVRALEAARSAGLALLLITGRLLHDLRRVCERLDLFDAVVAENGAVLVVPETDVIRDLGPPVPTSLLRALAARGVLHEPGRVIVGVGRQDEVAVREAVAASGLSLDLVPNRTSLMLLPGGVSKGTGLRSALGALGLSFHDVLGIGDAENDLALFESCGLAACPGDALPVVRDRADWVFPGEHGRAVALGILGPVLGGEPPPDRPRHRVELGKTAGTGQALTMPIRGVNLLLSGDVRRLVSSLVTRLRAGRYAICVLDGTGRFPVLEPPLARSPVRDEPGLQAALAPFQLEPHASAILDLSGVEAGPRAGLARAGLARAAALRRALGRPHWIVMDDPTGGGWLDADPGVAAVLANKGCCLVTERPERLPSAAREAFDLAVLGPGARPEDLAALGARLGPAAGRAGPVLRALGPEEGLLLDATRDGGAGIVRFRPTAG